MRIYLELFTKHKYLVLVVFFSILSGFALLHPGLPPTHDGEYHIIRFWQFYKVLTNGDLYPRWAPDLNNGYGIPLFTFVYPFPNYFASFLHVFHISFIDAFKLSMFFASVVGGIFFYLWSKEFWGTKGGLVASVFYTFSPYHFVDIYIRGSVGEVWVLGLFPIFLWSITKYIQKENHRYFFLAVISLSLTIFSHNILGLMFFVFAIFYTLFLLIQKKINIKKLFSSSFIFILSLGITAIFWLPALIEKKYTVGLQVFDITNNFPEIYQLIFPSWGTGFSTSDLQNQMSYQIGVANLFIILFCLGYLLFKIRKSYSEKRTLFFFLASFFLIFFLMLRFSLPLWVHIPLLSYFQFPWRLLSIEILCTSFLAGFLMRGSAFRSHKKRQIFIAIALVIFTVVLSKDYAKPDHYHMRDDKYYLSRSNFTDGTNSPGNAFNTKWMQANIKKVSNKISLTPSGSIISKGINQTSYLYRLSLNDKTKIIVNTAYFPGWDVREKGKSPPTLIEKNGLFSFVLPDGRHVISIQLRQTMTQSIASLISFASMCCLVFMYLKPKFVTMKK